MEHTLTSTNQEKKLLEFRGFSIAYNNLDSVKQTIDEIFVDNPYKFTSQNDVPFIIDAGSNIGIATLFFKALYRNAKVLCFEPDPNAFKMLHANIANNKIENTTLVNAALAREEGVIDLFGQIFVDLPDARGNSIIDTWGAQRAINNTTKVKSVKLSSYINSKVDFLKLDIEGAEQQVLEELEQENKLLLIQEIAMEVHQADKIKHINDLNVITSILNRNQFSIEVIERNTGDLLPEQIRNWQKQVDPHLFSIRAVRL